MLSWKRRTFFSLHKPAGRVSVRVRGRAYAHVTGALLHDDAEDDAFFHAEFGGLEDGVVDATDVLAAVARLEHLGFVGVEDGVEVFPGLFAREGGGWAGVVGEAHYVYLRVSVWVGGKGNVYSGFGVNRDALILLRRMLMDWVEKE